MNVVIIAFGSRLAGCVITAGVVALPDTNTPGVGEDTPADPGTLASPMVAPNEGWLLVLVDDEDTVVAAAASVLKVLAEVVVDVDTLVVEAPTALIIPLVPDGLVPPELILLLLL